MDTIIKNKDAHSCSEAELLARLKQYVCMEISVQELFGREDWKDDPFLDAVYTPTLEDMQCAFEKMAEGNVSREELMEWLNTICIDLVSNFDLDETEDDVLTILPDSPGGLLYYIWVILDDVPAPLQMLVDVQDIGEELLDLLGTILREKDLPLIQKTLSPRQRRRYIISLGDDKLLAQATAEQRELYVRVVEEGCRRDEIEALRAKGYGTYGGNTAFECDWDASRVCWETLFALTGEPEYANCLGYIHYYGRCTGEPDYEQAFRWFSVGAAHGLFESAYKLADMYLEGQWIMQSESASEHIIQDLYDKSLAMFCTLQEDACLADVALRMGDMWRRRGFDPMASEMAFSYYNIASYASALRLEHSDFPGDREVDEIIHKKRKAARDLLPDDYFTQRQEFNDPIWVMSFLEHFSADVTATLDEETNTARIYMRRCQQDIHHPVYNLLNIPELELTKRTGELIFRCEEVESLDFSADDLALGEPFYCDGVYDGGDGYWMFYSGEIPRMRIRGKTFYIQKEDYSGESV